MTWIEYSWFGVGFIAQGLFSARFLVQWLLSEKAKRSLMPVHFWYFSVAAAVLLLTYAVHRRDPVITIGQLLGLAIYLRNLQFIHHVHFTKRKIYWLWSWLLLCLPAIYIGFWLGPNSIEKPLILDNFWTAFGFVGQSLFTSRFLVQWWISERVGESIMPKLFWYLSLIGSLMLLTYAIAVKDPVIILGQAFGVVIYVRNLMLIRNVATAQKSTASP